MFASERVLAVDDDPTNLAIIKETFENKFHLRTVSSGEDALRIAPTFLPDVVLLDVMMPRIDGFQVCSRLKHDASLSNCQIIMVSARNALDDRLRGYQAGADDYVSKPLCEDELIAKVNAALRKSSANRTLQQELDGLCGATCELLGLMSHLHDKETGEHLDRIRDYSGLLAATLRTGEYHDQIDDQFLDNIYRASALHDIGKIAVPDTVLNKPGSLTAEERTQIEQHTILGEQLLDCIARQKWEPNLFKMAAEIARWHHERFDGMGYPDRLFGMQIPLAARIVKVADVFDALASARVYKPAYPYDQVRELMVRGKGTEFDPVIVDALIETFDELIEICEPNDAPATKEYFQREFSQDKGASHEP
jgi:putative two-component system response regulator